MSSNHTLVSVKEWNEMNQRIASTEAYVIGKEEEAARIMRIVEQRRREAETLYRENQVLIDRSVAELTNMFNEAAGAVRGRINTQLRTQSDCFGTEIQGMHAEIANAASRLSDFNARIDTLANTYSDIFHELHSGEQSSSLRAESKLNELDSLINLIDPLDPQRFLPDEYASLTSLRESIRVNLNSGDSQAAIIVSQNSISQAIRLLARLQLINEQYNARERTVMDNVIRLQRRIDELASPDGVLRAEIDGEMQEFEYDISFWSRGSFDSIVADFNNLQELLGNRPNLEQLDRIGSNIDILNDNLTVCDADARRNRVSALVAEDAAYRLHNGLSNTNWNLESSGFVSDDEREPYTMTYTDATGNTVSVVIAPTSPESPEIMMEVFSENEELAALTKDGIHASLEDEGLTIDSRVQRDDCHLNPDPETFIQNAVGEAREIIGLET